MRYSLLITMIILFFAGCKKDKYTTAPQISYKSVSPTVVDQNSQSLTLTIDITDAEGDLGITGSDTAFIYIKNLLNGAFDSLRFPDLQAGIAKNNFKADVEIDLSRARVFSCTPGPHTDTLFFEIYVTDFAKNKSNVIITGDAVYFKCP
ncbi:MAG: hypothetical protein IPL84_01680 [Chitinophagaceae bacterium]|nr:hypothetical protein [Chitinophagaceae bacterium]